MTEEDVLAERVSNLSSEFETIRNDRRAYIDLLGRIDTRVTNVEGIITKLVRDSAELQVTEREIQTKQKLTTAIGSFVGTGIIGIIVYVATHGLS